MTSLFRGGPPNLTLSDKGGRGVKNPQKRPDVIYGCPLIPIYVENGRGRNKP